MIEIGTSALVLASPRDPVSELSTTLTQGIAARGEGPYAVVVRSHAAASERRALDAAKAHGALVEFQPVGAPR